MPDDWNVTSLRCIARLLWWVLVRVRLRLRPVKVQATDVDLGSDNPALLRFAQCSSGCYDLCKRTMGTGSRLGHRFKFAQREERASSKGPTASRADFQSP